MPAELKKCSCYHCRAGMRNSYGNSTMLKARRAGRRRAKQALRQGKEPDRFIKIGYTD